MRCGHQAEGGRDHHGRAETGAIQPCHAGLRAVGGILTHIQILCRRNLAGFALGAGFFPTTIFGWLITIIIILLIIILARRISKAKHADHGSGHGPAHH